MCQRKKGARTRGTRMTELSLTVEAGFRVGTGKCCMYILHNKGGGQGLLVDPPVAFSMVLPGWKCPLWPAQVRALNYKLYLKSFFTGHLTIFISCV